MTPKSQATDGDKREASAKSANKKLKRLTTQICSCIILFFLGAAQNAAT